MNGKRYLEVVTESHLSPAVRAAHERAIEAGEDGYIDPESGYWVFTARFLAERGECCGSGCRHCPYRVEDR